MKSERYAASIDTNVTLEQLENEVWGQVPEGASKVVLKCHELRKKKLSEFEIEDFRLLISQNIGLAFLIPITIGMLTENAFADGDFYEGDLLASVLKSNGEFWEGNPALKMRVVEIFQKNKTKLLQSDLTQNIKEDLLQAFATFVKIPTG